MKYELLKERFGNPAGTIVYECSKPDYGLAKDDTVIFGTAHISVTKNEDGDYPFFTVPLNDLKQIIVSEYIAD